MKTRCVSEVMAEAYRLATDAPLRPEDAVKYLRDPKAFCRLLESSGALDDPVRRAGLEQLLLKEESDGV